MANPNPKTEQLKSWSAVNPPSNETCIKGAIASNKKQAEKKTLKERYALLDEYYTKKMSTAQTDKEAKKILDKSGYRAWKRYQMINDPKVPYAVKAKIIEGIDNREEGNPVETVNAKIEGNLELRSKLKDLSIEELEDIIDKIVKK